jgi:hypothetical protein
MLNIWTSPTEIQFFLEITSTPFASGVASCRCEVPIASRRATSAQCYLQRVNHSYGIETISPFSYVQSTASFILIFIPAHACISLFLGSPQHVQVETVYQKQLHECKCFVEIYERVFKYDAFQGQYVENKAIPKRKINIVLICA